MATNGMAIDHNQLYKTRRNLEAPSGRPCFFLRIVGFALQHQYNISGTLPRVPVANRDLWLEFTVCGAPDRASSACRAQLSVRGLQTEAYVPC